MRTIYLLSLLLTMLTLGSASCEGPAGCQPPLNGTYEFEIPVQLSPARDTFRVGDTIKVRSRFSHDVRERTTGQTFELRDWKFYPLSKLLKIDVNPATERTWADEFIVRIDTSKYNYHLFTYSDNDVALSGEYSYLDEVYEIDYEMIALVPGIFMLSHIMHFYYFDPDQYFPGKCRSDQSEGYVLMNDGADNNAHLLAASPDPHYHHWMTSRLDDRFHRFGGYCFVVVE